MLKPEFGQIAQEFFPLQGGLDLITPAISLQPGRCIDAQNYEPVNGVYSRISGYEAYDGHASPSAASYWIMGIGQTGTISAGDTITGATSTATAKVLAVLSGSLVLGRITTPFTVGENITDGGVVGTVTTAALQNSAPDPSDDADYALLAANDRRLNISKVPGSGRIRGVWVYKDVVYAFRDNVGATAGNMYKATASGWSQITFGREIQFGSATGQINVGDTVTGGTSGATAVVVAALLRTGTWTVAGAGTLIFASVTGAFTSGEALRVGGVSKATSTTVDTAITRLPGGSMEFDNINFTGSTSTQKMYGVDGVNLAFEFDGTTYIPIRTGMTVDTPTHVKGHRSYLFLSFLGSVQYSGIGNPYAWTVVLGAGEIGTGDPVTGFVSNSGSAVAGSTLQIFTSNRLHTLYGSSNADFRLVSSNSDIGFSAFTAQLVSNDVFGMTARGIQAVTTTLNFGDFDYASVSHVIQPLITQKKGLEIASTAIKSTNQYRVFFSDNTALAVGLTGDKVSAIMPLNYGMPVRCIVTTTLSTGQEVTYFGSDDGYVYQDNVGTSQNGNPIEAWLRLPFNHSKSPQVLKTYKRAILEGVVRAYCELNISFDLGYGSPDVLPSAPVADTALTGGGGYWDQFIWDQFTWDAAIINAPSIKLFGTETNISLLFYSNRAQDQPHTLQGITIVYSPRRLKR